MKKRLTFQKAKDGHYVVVCGKVALGMVMPKGEIFTKRTIFTEDIDRIEWTSECLFQLAEFVASLEKELAQQPLTNKGLPCQ